MYKFLLALSKNKEIAEDITQETFMKAIKGLDSFKGGCDIKVWLCQIAKNTYYTYAKKNQRIIPDSEEILLDKPSDCDFVKETIDAEEAMRIHQILHNMSEPYKEVFNLRVFGELSFNQISRIYGKTESWARVTYHRAKIMIVDEMNKSS